MGTIRKRSGVGSLIVVALACAISFGITYHEVEHPQPTPRDTPPTEHYTPNATPHNSRQTAYGSTSVRAETPSDTEQFSSTSAPYRRLSKTYTTPTFVGQDGIEYPLRTYKTAANDPYSTQWWTTSTHLGDAWSIGAGTYQTTVAVIDTGFGLSHEELIGRWATNTAEQGATLQEAPSILNCSDRSIALNMSCNLIDDNYDTIVDNESGATTQQNPSQLNCTAQGKPLDKSCNRIDDDNNSLVDDVTGWDFANYDASVQAGQIDPSGTGTQHGTQVSGIMAATGDNNKGIAGVNWSTKILPLQALADDSYGNTLSVARAIYYAVSRGVDLISMSLGSDEEDAYLRQAIQYALDHNVLVVSAAGNDGCDCLVFPAAYPEVFAVGSNNSIGNRSYFSSYGLNLDVLAPGENMRSSTWTSGNPTSAYAVGINGTSFATPYVSGLLALARSHQPAANWGELTTQLIMNADHTGLSTSSPFLPQIGSGQTMAGSYIQRVASPAQPMVRYEFGPSPHTGTLGSARIYDCVQSGDFPSSQLYEVEDPDTMRYYTIDTLSAVRAQTAGKTVTQLYRVCAGLSNDQPATLRNINLLSELRGSAIMRY